MARVRDLERRMKVVRLPLWYFVDCLIINAWAPGDCVTKLSLEGVPEDTIVVHAAPHHIDNTVAVVLYNEQWELIPDAQLIPTIDARPSHILVNASIPRAEAVRQPIQSGVANVARDSLHTFLERVVKDHPPGKPVDPLACDWSTEKPDDTWRDRKPLL